MKKLLIVAAANLSELRLVSTKSLVFQQSQYQDEAVAGRVQSEPSSWESLHRTILVDGANLIDWPLRSSHRYRRDLMEAQ